ncbi:chaperonin 10-like protein [Mycena amicta]|nr:chaperonin 10-like protein [Mycena amicta]
MQRTSMKASVTLGNGTVELQDVEIPQIHANQVLVKVVAAAQNPTDWKTLMLNLKSGNIMGCDFAGVVVNIGSEVPTALRKRGERVAGFVHGGIGPNGAFAEYVAADAELLIALPDEVSFENGAQLGIACITTCQALYQTLSLAPPISPQLQPASSDIDILIWSGTSATGQYAIQFAKLMGMRVLSTASAKNFEFVLSVGADTVFDYTDSRTCKRIAAATKNALRYAMDCTSEGMTPFQTSMSLGAAGGTIATLLPCESQRPEVEPKFVLAYSYLGKAVEFPFKFPAHQEHYENGKTYCKLISDLLFRGALRPVPMRLYPHGLASVRSGLQDMKDGKIHAEKVTYRISDTPGLMA